MARIRTLKPEFWSDEKLGPLAPLDRLVFLGLVSQADDAGRVIDSIRLIDGLLFSLTDDTCGPSLTELAAIGVIERGLTASGQRVIQIVGWTKHQKIEKPSFTRALPPIERKATTSDPSPKDRRSLPDSSPTHRVQEVDLGSGSGPRTEEVEVEGDLRATPPPASPPTFLANHPQVLELLGPLKHGNCLKATAMALEHRFLYGDGPDDGAMGDPVVKGLPLAERKRLVLGALVEFSTQPEPFSPRFFAGFVGRLRGAPVAPTRDSREREAEATRQRAAEMHANTATPEQAAAGLKLLRDTLRGPGAAA